MKLFVNLTLIPLEIFERFTVLDNSQRPAVILYIEILFEMSL